MRVDDRAARTAALEPARRAAYPAGEYVGQESFMTATEILALAQRAGIGRGVAVLDLCCGTAGPGRLVTATLGCRYRGVDRSAAAVDLARRAAGDLPCRFEVAEVPPVPPGPFDVVLLLETLLAFRHKEPLLEGVASALRPDGRFAFTVEEGLPLSAQEREAMPASGTVWPVALPTLRAALARVGLEIVSLEDHSTAHGTTAAALADAFVADRSAIAARIDRRTVDDLVTAHRLWVRWLRSGRIRKLGVVAVRTAEPRRLRARSSG